MAAPRDAVVVVGGGLAGVLVALALISRGLAVTLVAPAEDPADPPGSATSLSYGAMLGFSARRHWRQLESCHGPLGFAASGLVLHSWGGWLDQLPPPALALLSAALPVGQVDSRRFTAALPRVLAAAGVNQLDARVLNLQPRPGGGWILRLAGPDPSPSASLESSQVVLAAGAFCRSLWPSLVSNLRHSWAGVLIVRDLPAGNPWLEQVRRGRVVQPRAWRRPALEARSAALTQDAWIVDAGLAPWGSGALLGQITLVPAGPGGLVPPDPTRMEQRLRRGLALLDPALARLDADYRQVPVAFCADGGPLVGPIAAAPGLWSFAGFSGPFATAPALAEQLAADLAAA
ncbi:FAD-dependent oxidoreductase [Synechococcus sp. CS-602]|uniref:FAD-dependent oxidoreductase n=1 Tax=Synechococcaceae TaxID=1890426 RepID=UPI0008FF07BB|nr:MULTISPECIES: FAD-dependent oxidoreductase [Synechococcaceae]MCT4363664.1 FAD-dependent oxidoreductase [Candidatus Regnicoccus frigidus MAG-AL1]APD47328.1 hypothetical protein BM449_02175 [Synechococcus sp. SynAce01]MCT0202774.1 FAD-dependent oxidoreductase [Synechococcus sp. CS-603]MCT0203687.1 FAD-dependent oxidoreductase [Synechococcus sp. CS-602]MCT0245316.1 FAD-dependent oxidoreductase [Synechococcus sp. CS-601]